MNSDIVWRNQAFSASHFFGYSNKKISTKITQKKSVIKIAINSKAYYELIGIRRKEMWPSFKEIFLVFNLCNWNFLSKKNQQQQQNKIIL